MQFCKLRSSSSSVIYSNQVRESRETAKTCKIVVLEDQVWASLVMRRVEKHQNQRKIQTKVRRCCILLCEQQRAHHEHKMFHLPSAAGASAKCRHLQAAAESITSQAINVFFLFFCFCKKVVSIIKGMQEQVNDGPLNRPNF